MNYEVILNLLSEKECSSFLSVCKDGKRFLLVSFCGDEKKVYSGKINGNSITYINRDNNVKFEIKIDENKNNGDDNTKIVKINEKLYVYNVDETLLSD
ncbi:hypothetical protein V6M85_06650 [Sulfolobus tengchongensis]|uniref:Uncharacterized protein n=1 Tax=Sulfolobus tengchongensis TaxID=207809 RepID=A0AAX4KWD4_9CREN